jgi:gluconate 5-dehydrogenase
MDVRDEQSVEDGIAAARNALGGIDVLVNNAGIGMRTVNRRFMTDPQPFWTVGPDRFRDLFATNVTGYFLLARVVAPVMAAIRWLASADSDGITDCRVVATDFADGVRPTAS